MVVPLVCSPPAQFLGRAGAVPWTASAALSDPKPSAVSPGGPGPSSLGSPEQRPVQSMGHQLKSEKDGDTEQSNFYLTLKHRQRQRLAAERKKTAISMTCVLFGI